MNKPAIQSQDLNADQQSCAAWIARFLKARGIDRIFGLQGGHIQPIWDHVARQGIRIIDVRDEGAAVHMAHAHAELTGQFGVAMVTAGPGVTNTVTAIANASLARIPVLLIGGDRDPSLAPMQVMKRKIRGAKLVVLSPASHFANRDQPAAWNRAALDFLARVERKARRTS